MAYLLPSAVGPAVLKVRPKFDQRARFAWATTICILLLQQMLYAWTGLKLVAPELFWAIALGAPLIIFAAVIRRLGSRNLSTMIEALSLLAIGGLGAALLQYPMLVLSGPLVDRWLHLADAFLGFHWPSFARLFADPKVDLLLFVAYDFFRTQGVLVIMYLSMTGQANRTWQLLTAALGSLLIAVILLAAFPADGAFVGCGLKLGYLPVHDNLCTYGPVINGVKSGAVQSIDSTMYLGLASLPSFHIAGGLLLVWAVWHSKFWRWPSLILNSLMGIATVAIAGHYFVDVIGGVLLGAAAIFVAKRLLPDAPPNQEADASA